MSQADFGRSSESAGGSQGPLPVPPPAPPAAMPPPVPPRLPASARGGTASATGLGSARGIRWRGELDAMADEAGAAPGDQPGATPRERVSREAPPWLVSLVFHLVFLLVLAVITAPQRGSIGQIVLDLGQSRETSQADLAEFSLTAPESIQQDAFQETEVESIEIFESVQLSEVQNITPVEIGVGAVAAVDQPMFNGRRGAMKETLLALYGGTAETQTAVEMGLEWLARNQTRAGGWSMRGPYRDGALTENRAAATAMALLAFLGDGYTHKSDHEYGQVVQRGVKYLLSLQARDGFFAADGAHHEQMYAQAQATIAICELYGMTQDSWLRQPAQQALDFAFASQSDKGGWRYGSVRSGSPSTLDADTSVTGWFVMALMSGEAAGLEGNRYALDKVSRFLDTVSSYEGSAYAYQPRGTPSAAMTAEGLLCRQYLGWSRNHPPMRQGIEALLLDAPFDASDRDVYYWYYATQVLHHYGGGPWQQWNDVMRAELPQAQSKSGRERGSWPPQADRWGRFGRLYTTCLSLYCLEVYYRHMPLYQVSVE